MKKTSLIWIIAFSMILILSACAQNANKKINGFDYIGIEQLTKDKTPSGIITLIASEGEAPLEIHYLQPLDDKHLYEIWLFDKELNSMDSLGTFTVNKSGQAVINARASTEMIKKSDAVIITKEEFPVESKEPSNNVVLRGEIGFQADVIEVKLKKDSEIKKEEPKTDAEKKTEEPKTKVEEIKPGTVIIAKETDKVVLATDAVDPDSDKLVYAYTTPFNSNGEWQTNYGDAGEYTVTVTVSDGELSTAEQILVIVNKKEETPVIVSFKPESLSIDIKEDSSVEFSASATDLNKDEVFYTWKVDGAEKGSGDVFLYTAGFDDSGQHDVRLEVTDSITTTSQVWKLNIENVNRKPILDKIADISLRETETARISPTASDPDNDQLTFTITDPIQENGEWQTDYDDAGEYTVTISVSDGKDTVSQQVKITVKNVNRPPIIKGITNK